MAHYQYVGQGTVSVRFPSNSVTVATGDVVDLVPSEVTARGGSDFSATGLPLSSSIGATAGPTSPPIYLSNVVEAGALATGQGIQYSGGQFIPANFAFTTDLAARLSTLGSRIWTFGHSYLQGGGVTHVDFQYITRLAGMLRSDLRDLGVGASEAANDQQWRNGATGQGGWAYLLQSVIPTSASAPYTPGVNYLPFVNTGLNDALQHSHDASGAPRTIFKTGLRTHLSRLCAARLFESTDAAWAFAGSGTWQTKLDTLKNSGTQYKPFPANGATATFTIPADYEAGAVLALGFTVWPAGDGQITWSGTASVLPSTTALSGLAYAANGATGDAKRDSSNGHVVRISGLVASDAGKTVIATYGSGAGTTFSTPAAPSGMSTVGTAGAVTLTYTRVYRTYNGDTIPSAGGSIATANATLSGSNYVSIPAGGAWPAGVEAELIVRTVGGTPGIVATLTTGPAIVLDQANVAPGGAYTPLAANPLVGGAAVNYAQIESVSPITRGVVCNIAQLPAAQITALSPVTNTDITNYNTDITSVVNEFAANQWLVIDVDTALGQSATLFQASPGVHPNNRGHAVIAATCATAISTWAIPIALSDQAHQSRVEKRVTGRTIIKSPVSGSTWGTAGTLFFPNGSWGDADSANVIAAIDAQPGDDIEVTLNSAWVAANIKCLLDVCSTNGTAGQVINYFATGTSSPGIFGQPCWSITATSPVTSPLGGSILYTVQPSDLVTYFTVPGIVLVKLRGIGTGVNQGLYAGNFGIPFQMQVKNLGPRNTPGFNAS